MSATPLRVLLVINCPGHADPVRDALRELGIDVVGLLDSGDRLLPAIARFEFDILLIDVVRIHDPVLTDLKTLQALKPLPIIIFTAEADTWMIERVIDAGVAACVIDGFNPRRIKAIIDMAITRFRANRQLQQELDATRSKLEVRKVVARATGLLMTRYGLSEADAYQRLRNAAMRSSRDLGEVAGEVVSAAGDGEGGRDSIEGKPSSNAPT